MATRHQVRQSVISLLYANEMGSEMQEFCDEYLEDRKIRNRQRDFTNSLLNGILNNLEKIDESLNENLSEYKIDEVSAVDRAILRLGAYEILHTDTDNAVIINEAIELAKEMSNDTSPKFVNGVLDALVKK
ncbi:transcription antitermination protein [Campylobacter blaseri]|uniref:Transcription antitermination protein NusB n=1 Tax=Campylobacter blaseri TaxID=2042961 RepID=A0A2P8R1H0_9BACT|nr:transcription antitermination factor NusB [Campylobacter blaseri]PSM52345.1 transcription antitermination factor NusB [Campylobacter blaseri]PSM54111.1 transcription antitermination factor NusB [Campylobacter blaseri]QKF85555.1 transcription antitermination protein [Campylobacter blaseri]